MSDFNSLGENEVPFFLMGDNSKDFPSASASNQNNGLRLWKTTDSGFESALRSHVEALLEAPISDDYFENVLTSVKYCEYSHNNFDENFNSEKYQKAQQLCEKLNIHGNFVGESSGE